MVRNYSSPQADAWYQSLIQNPENIPFSFVYDNELFHGFPAEHFALLDKTTERSGSKETTLFSYAFKNILTVLVKVSHYFSHGVTEWTVAFENNSDRNSGILMDLKTTLTLSGEAPVLRGIYGDHDNFYKPYVFDLVKEPVHFRSDSGRATHVDFPYFNLEYGDGGVMLAIGWAGTWAADFVNAEDTVTCTLRSVNELNTYLKPGEKIRTALFVFAPYGVRDEHYATNFWRSWYMEHTLPKADASGAPFTPFSTASFASDTGLPNSDGSISERYFTWKPTFDKLLEERLPIDFRWFDAGWYVAPDGTSPEVDWWGTVGTWTLDPVKWPGRTFLESTDYARAHGMKTLMWFEPERVTDPENLAKNYGYNLDWAIIRENAESIPNNIGIPECLEWTTNQVCKVLRENKVEMYREDNNSDPGALWLYLDNLEGENRRGITECKFIMGHYKMWDDIIACTLSYGGCGFVDSCASGGGRNDLESMRRGVPLLRSDYDRTTTAIRLSMSSSLLKWLPVCGANSKEKKTQLAPTGDSDIYIWRASYLPILNVDSQYVQDPDQDFDNLRFGLNEWKKVAPYQMKEFYPLTSWHHGEDNTGFTSYAFFDPETETGVLLGFRQEQCVDSSLTVRLPFVPKGQRLILTDADSGEELAITGSEVTLNFPDPRLSRLLWLKLDARGKRVPTSKFI